MKTLLDKFSREKLFHFCKNNQIVRLSVFGSAQRNDLSPDSDIDLLVEFKEGSTPSFFELFEMEKELSSIFGGRKVDLRTAEDLSRHFRNQVKEIAEEIYHESRLS